MDWERNRFRVDSPKTGERWVPIFPELRPYLAEVFDLAEPGAVHVINRYRESNCNLRTQLQRIIRKAGVSPWTKLFHNLRECRTPFAIPKSYAACANSAVARRLNGLPGRF